MYYKYIKIYYKYIEIYYKYIQIHSNILCIHSNIFKYTKNTFTYPMNTLKYIEKSQWLCLVVVVFSFSFYALELFASLVPKKEKRKKRITLKYIHILSNILKYIKIYYECIKIHHNYIISTFERQQNTL
jgi:hypothetical protein